MKKSFFIALIAAMLLSVHPVFAQCANQVNCNSESIISVNGQASEFYPPDTAFVTLAVETMGKNASSAATQNKQKAQQVIDSVSSMLNTNKGEYIKTTSYSVRPNYTYNKSSQKREIDGYIVLNQVKVKTISVSEVGSIIDTAIKNGANKVNRVWFAIENMDKYRAELLSKATRQAKMEAHTIASCLGLKLHGIKRASTGSMVSPRMPAPYYATAKVLAESADMAANTPVEAGDIELKAHVSIDFLVK